MSCRPRHMRPWMFNVKRALQKCHFSIPPLDIFQIASGPMIPSVAFMWPQVAQHLIQKGKRRYSLCAAQRLQAVWWLMLHHGVLGVGWFGQAAVLCVTLQTWSQQLPLDILSWFCDWLFMLPTIHQEGTCFVISTRELWFGSHKSTILRSALLKNLLKQQWVIGLKHCSINSYFQHCKMQKDIIIIIPWHILVLYLISCYCVV